jgi:hypothetical protein
MKVLIITDGLIDDTSPIGTVLETIVGCISGESLIVTINLLDSETTNLSKFSQSQTSFIFQKPRENYTGFPRTARLGEYLSALEIKTCGNKFQEIASSHEWDLVLISLYSQSSIRIAKSLLFRPKSKVVTLLWDDFRWWGMSSKVPSEVMTYLLDAQMKILRSSSHVIVPSTEMALKLVHETKAEVIVLHPVFVEAKLKQNSSAMVRTGIVIGFAGQTYSSTEIRLVANALGLLTEKYPNLAFELRVYSKDEKFSREINCRYMGYRNKSELHYGLSSCDLLLLPFPREAWFSEIIRGSFPSKLSNYAAARRPVFYLGPLDSSVARFLSLKQYPMMIDTVSAHTIAHYIEEFMLSKALKESCTRIIESIYDEHFSSEAFHKSLTRIDDRFLRTPDSKKIETDYFRVHSVPISKVIFLNLLRALKLFQIITSFPSRIKRKILRKIFSLILVKPDHVES